MDFKSEITNKIIENLQKLQLEIDAELILKKIEVPKDKSMGDFAFPCFLLAKQLKKAPPLIAKELQSWDWSTKTFSKIEAKGPYLNFFVNSSSLAQDLIPSILNGEFLKAREKQEGKTMIEYSQPNTHKPFHVGHARNACLGDSLVRVLEWTGEEVIAANYIGDVGTHIAIILWQYLKEEEKYDSNQDSSRGEFLGRVYVAAKKLLDLSRYTKAPHPKVITVEVLSKNDHPSKKNWKLFEVSNGEQTWQVVSAVSNANVGDILAFAKEGAKIGGRRVVPTDKEGVLSQGMLCSPQEISLGEETEVLYHFSKDTPLNQEIANLFAYPEFQNNEKVLEVIQKREAEVSSVLQRLEKKDSFITQLWQETKEWSMQDFYKIYDWLRCRFDHYFYESEVAEPGKNLVQEYLQKGIFEKDDGAIGVNLDEYELPFFLVLKSDGTGLYSTKDLALAELKFREFQIQKSIYVVDNRQSLHFQQVFRSLEKMGYEQAQKSYHLPYGMVVLPDGAMSSRTGEVVLFRTMKESIEKSIYNNFLKQYEGDWSKQEIQKAAHYISLATVRYSMLNQDNNKNITFDLEEWTSQTGNTGPYLMYAYTRTRSILREVEKRQKLDYTNCDWTLLSDPHEIQLLNKMKDFPEIVKKAASRFQVQQICIYAYELSKNFSRMYDHCSVLKAESPELQLSRAALVDSCGQVIGKCLELLGIPSLERM